MIELHLKTNTPNKKQHMTTHKSCTPNEDTGAIRGDQHNKSTTTISLMKRTTSINRIDKTRRVRQARRRQNFTTWQYTFKCTPLQTMNLRLFCLFCLGAIGYMEHF